MKYQLLCADQSSVLMAQVNEYMAKGWRPLGGVAIAESAKMRWLYQAMILDGEMGEGTARCLQREKKIREASGGAQ